MEINTSCGLATLLLAVTLSRADENTNSLPRIASSNGQIIATLAPNNKILITDCGGNLVRKFYHCAPVTGKFSMDGLFICAAGRGVGGSGSLKVWRVSDGTLVAKMDNDMNDVPHIVF